MGAVHKKAGRSGGGSTGGGTRRLHAAAPRRNCKQLRGIITPVCKLLQANAVHQTNSSISVPPALPSFCEPVARRFCFEAVQDNLLPTARSEHDDVVLIKPQLPQRRQARLLNLQPPEE